MTEEQLKKGVKKTLIILFIFVLLIIGLSVYIFYNRNTPKSIFTSAEAREEYQKISDTTENLVEEITDENQINQILNTDLEVTE